MKIVPLTPARWKDLERLFGPRGACGGCWCMWWRIPRKQWVRQKGAGNKRAFRAIVKSGRVPGLLAYDRGRPVAWASVAPLAEFPALHRRRIDDAPVWSVNCFYVAPGYRGRGLTVKLLKAAARRARGRVLEGYPVERAPAAAFAWTGYAGAFRKAGFVEVARRSKGRPVVRRAT